MRPLGRPAVGAARVAKRRSAATFLARSARRSAIFTVQDRPARTSLAASWAEYRTTSTLVAVALSAGSRPSAARRLCAARSGVATVTTCARSPAGARPSVAVVVSSWAVAEAPARRQACTTSASPAATKPSASSPAPGAEPAATRRPDRALKIARSQSPRRLRSSARSRPVSRATTRWVRTPGAAGSTAAWQPRALAPVAERVVDASVAAGVAGTRTRAPRAPSR